MSTEENKNNPIQETQMPSITGHLAKRLMFAPLRVLMIVTGVTLIEGLFVLVSRFLLALRRKATATVQDGSLVLDVEWSIMGKSFRKTKTLAPLSTVVAVRFEDRKQYLHLLMGFGFLAVGTWVGIQWLVDGLRAGFPFLALVGAGVVVAGIAIDILLYQVVPEGKGRRRMFLAMGPWIVRIVGVDATEGGRFLDAVSRSWRSSLSQK